MSTKSGGFASCVDARKRRFSKTLSSVDFFMKPEVLRRVDARKRRFSKTTTPLAHKKNIINMAGYLAFCGLVWTTEAMQKHQCGRKTFPPF